MIGTDRDPLRERQQIHEISMNVRRRLARVSEQSRHVAPHVAADIESSAAVVLDIEYEIAGVMSALPPSGMLDRSTLRHVLGCQQRALEMVELLEAMAAAAPFGSALVYDQARPRALPSPAMFAASDAAAQRTQGLGQVLATATLIDQGALRYQPAGPGHGWPGGAPHPYSTYQPAHPARRPHPAQGAEIPAVLTRIADSLASHAAAPARSAAPHPASRSPMRRLVAKPASATVATIAATFAASVVLWSFVFSSGGEGPQARASMAAADTDSGKKLGGRLAEASPIETGSVEPGYTTSGAAGITVTPPDGPGSRPMQVVLSTRSTAEEVKQDFLTFRETYPQILGGVRAKVERLGEKDGQIRHRLVIVPAMPLAEAKAVCGKLSQMGFSGCWVRPQTVASAQP